MCFIKLETLSCLNILIECTKGVFNGVFGGGDLVRNGEKREIIKELKKKVFGQDDFSRFVRKL